MQRCTRSPHRLGSVAIYVDVASLCTSQPQSKMANLELVSHSIQPFSQWKEVISYNYQQVEYIYYIIACMLKLNRNIVGR